MGCTGLYKGQMWFFCSTVRWINSLSFLLFLNLYITVTTEELRLHSFCQSVARPKPWTHLACAAWPHAYYSDLTARSDQSGKMLRDICMVWDISDIQSEDVNSWAVCHLPTYSLSPLFFPLYYYLSLRITIFELCCHSYEKAEKKVGCRKNSNEVWQVSWCFRQEWLGKESASLSAVLLSNTELLRTPGFPLG